MGQIDNLNSSVTGRIYERLRTMETAPTATNTAIGRNGMLVYDGGVIEIENGGLDVTGTATISGTLTGSGNIGWSGPVAFTGNVNLNGPTDINGALTVDGNTTVSGTFNVNGPMKTTGTLSVEGVTTLKNDLNVTTGGKIKAGVTQINPDGTIAFGSSLQVTPDNGAGQAAIMAGASQIVLTPSNPTYWAQFTGGAYFQGLITGMALKLNSLPTTTAAPNLHIAADGTVMRSTAV